MGPAASRVRVIAHRGASRDCPENTLAAFDEALRQGADGLELDVQLSRDGVPVVYHDRTLSKAGGGRRRVAGCDWSELRSLDVGGTRDPAFAGQTIPRLEAVLERYGSRTRLLVEIKTREGPRGGARHHDLARRVVRLVGDRGLESSVMVLCFDPEVLAVCADEAPGVPRVLNLKPPPLLTRGVRKRLEAIDALSADVSTLTARFGAALVRAGMPLLVYTCNTPGRVARAVAAGAQGVMSDRPGWLADRLRRLGETDAT